MAKIKTKADEYKDIFGKLHRYQIHGAYNLILLLYRYLRGNTEYMAHYIDLVAERSGVSQTGRITTTNKDIMLPVVTAMIEIDKGTAPCYKELQEAWESFISDFRNHKIKL